MTNVQSRSGKRLAGLALIFLFMGMILALFDLTEPLTVQAANFDVTTTADAVVPPAGSLREAITLANAAGVGLHTITFTTLAGPQVINLVAALPTITNNNVTIGSTGAAAADTCQPTGPGGRGVPRITVTSFGGATVLNISGNNSTVQGLNLTGATTVANAGLVISGTGNTIRCNYIGTNAAGTAAAANAIGISITGGTTAAPNVIGGPTATEANLISGNTTSGIDIAATAAGTRIFGNLIGTNANGLTAAAAAIANFSGIEVAGDNTVIGNTTSSQVIAGNTTFGIHAAVATATNLSIVGNYIGSNPANVALANAEGIFINAGGGDTIQRNFVQRNSGPGIDFQGTVSNVTVSGNTVSNNGNNGVIINSTGTNIRLSQNTIFTNGGLGIDVLFNNTPDATPAAPNTAIPVLTNAVWDGTKMRVQGTAVAGANVEIFFTDTPPDASNYGEARYFLVGTMANGAGNFDTGPFSLPLGVPTPTTASRVTATATPLTGANTSEFALNIPVTLPPFTLVKAGVLSANKSKITWTIVASNNNALDITNASMVDVPAPALPFVAGSLTTTFSTVAPGNSVTAGTFPTGALTFNLVSGSSLTITFDVTVPANAAPGASFFNLATVTAAGVNGGAPFNSNLAKVKLPGDDKGSPADVVLRCKITPDREASDDEGNEIKITCKIKNAGKGRAHGLRIFIPIDISLIVGYASFSDPRMWVSQIILTGDSPYILVSMPDMDEGEDMTSTIVFRPKHEDGKSLKGKKVALRVNAGWDDDDGPGKKRKSNGLVFVFGESNKDVSGGDTQQFTQGDVTLEINQKIEFGSEQFEPDEIVTFWLTKPDNTSIPLPQGRADRDGKIIFLLDAASLGLSPGVFVFVGRGNRTEILVVSVVIILQVGGGGGDGTPSPSASPSTTPSVSPSVSPSTTPSVSPSATPTVTTTVSSSFKK